MKSNKKTGKNRLDKYYHLAKEHGYRSRSAFKIIQLSKKFNIFQNCNVLVDLCAAPGGWLQVASKQLPVSSTIIGVDLVPIKPIKGVITFQSDIRTPKCRSLIMSQLKGSEVDVVLHDGSPNMGCNWNLDAFNQNTLVLSAAKLACSILKKGGIFVTKIFRSSDYNSLVWMLGNCFDKIKVTKPQSSRNVSAEIFAICIGFKSLKSLDPRLFNTEFVFHTEREKTKVTDDKQNKSLNQLFKEQKKTNREGYEEGSIYSEISVLDFLRSDTPASLLVNNNKLLFSPPKSKAKESESTSKSDKENKNKKEKVEVKGKGKLEEESEYDSESGEQDKELIHLVESDPLTTEEVKLLCSDLKVAGKSDLQSLLKWRFKLLKSIPELDKKKQNKNEVDNEKDKENKLEKLKEEDVELNIEEEDKKIKDMIQHEKRRNERKQRKMLKKIKKGSTTESCSYLGPDPELFNLESLNGRKMEEEGSDQLDEDEEELEKESEDDDGEELEFEDDGDEEDENKKEKDRSKDKDRNEDKLVEGEQDYDTDLDSDSEYDDDLYYNQDLELEDYDMEDGDIEDPEFRRLMKMDVDLEVRHNIDKINETQRPKNKKLSKREKANLDKSLEMKQFLERMQYEAKMEAAKESESDMDSDREEEDNKDYKKKEKKNKKEKEKKLEKPEEDEEELEFEDDSDEEVEEDGEDEQLEVDEPEHLEDVEEELEDLDATDIVSSRWFDQEIFDPNVEKENLKVDKKKKRDRKSKKEREREKGRDKDNEGFQVVPAISNSDIKELVKNDDFKDLSNDPDSVAHVQALGSLLLDKKTRMELIDGAYNKKTFMDEGENLPSWFTDDENKHNKRQYPVSKELMKKYKAKLLELKKRPIKKVLEAKHRKAIRAQKRFKSILPKIEAISSDVNSTGNANKLLRGLKKIKSNKRDKVYVISRKTGSTKTSKTFSVGSRKMYKPVDRRMKKDNRRSKMKPKRKSRKARIH